MNRKLQWFYTSFRLIVLFACILAISFSLSEQKGLADPAAVLIRVAVTGSDTSDCGSDSKPCRTIQYAVNKAGASDYIVTVAEGVYTYNQSADQCSWAITRAVVCIVDKNITLLGGYSPSNWYISDPVNHKAVIDGQNSVRGVMINKYNSTASLVMDGFIIQNGLAQGLNNTSDDYNSRGFGAGIWSQRAPMTLRRIILRNNRAIGGNTSGSHGGFGTGGAVAVEAGPGENVPISMNDILIENNQALGGDGVKRGGLALGGGVFAFNDYIVMTDVVIRNNLVKSGSSTGDGVDAGEWADALGGGVAMQIDSSGDFVRVEMINNQAIGGNAGTAVGSHAGSGLGGGLYIEQAPVTMQDSVISGNTAIGGTAAVGGLAYGGGIMINYTDVTIDRTQVINNLARSGGSSPTGSVGEASGGGLFMAAYANPGQSHLVLTNSVVADNQVEAGSQGIARLVNGAGITIQAVTLDLIHCTVANNQFLSKGRDGQALSVKGSQVPGGVPAIVNIRYSIISDHVNTSITDDNTSALTVYFESTANLNTVMFYNNTNNTNANWKPIQPGTINQVNSLFPAGPIGYISPGSPYFNYHLQGSSPAIDQAMSSTTSEDMDGQPRPLGAARDIGADEYIDVDSVYLPLTLR
jgi:hypothetical protein